MRSREVVRYFLVGLLGFLVGAFIGADLGDSLLYKIERYFLSRQEILASYFADLDQDGATEHILVRRIKFPSRHYYSECFLEIYRESEKLWQSESLGMHLKAITLSDLNGDQRKEVITKWEDVTTQSLNICAIDKNGIKEVFSGQGKDVLLFDIDKDGIQEIVEYQRDYDKPFIHFNAALYRWDGERYSLLRNEVPVANDRRGRNMLILGKGNVVVLR